MLHYVVNSNIAMHFARSKSSSFQFFNNDIAINPNLVTIFKLIFAYVALHEVHLLNVSNIS
jgi:predicted metal-dependent hydrolase